MKGRDEMGWKGLVTLKSNLKSWWAPNFFIVGNFVLLYFFYNLFHFIWLIICIKFMINNILCIIFLLLNLCMIRLMARSKWLVLNALSGFYVFLFYFYFGLLSIYPCEYISIINKIHDGLFCYKIMVFVF